MAALAAFYNRAKVAHVEAGLRSFNKQAPFPEEVNRVLTTGLTDLHFAPTAMARQNLLREGVPSERIHVTGNTVVDVVEHIARRLDAGELVPPLARTLTPLPKPFILVTAHRRENHEGEKIREIFQAIRELSSLLPGFGFIFPVHPNPQVRVPAEEILGHAPNVYLIPPADYVSFVWLMQHSRLILSDSGGVQEEAPSLGKVVLVMREVTERPEGIEAGFLRIVGVSRGDIVSAVLEEVLDGRSKLRKCGNPYGDAQAAKRIVAVLKSALDSVCAVGSEELGAYVRQL